MYKNTPYSYISNKNKYNNDKSDTLWTPYDGSIISTFDTIKEINKKKNNDNSSNDNLSNDKSFEWLSTIDMSKSHFKGRLCTLKHNDNPWYRELNINDNNSTDSNNSNNSNNSNSSNNSNNNSNIMDNDGTTSFLKNISDVIDNENIPETVNVKTTNLETKSTKINNNESHIDYYTYLCWFVILLILSILILCL